MTAQKRKDDIFMLQVRLFRLAQLEWNLSASECDEIFSKYEINDYISTCYDIFQVQGDDTNLADIECYLENRSKRSDSLSRSDAEKILIN